MFSKYELKLYLLLIKDEQVSGTSVTITVINRGRSRYIKGGRILHFTWTSKILTPVAYDTLCRYNVISRATTIKAMPRYTQKLEKKEENQNGILKNVQRQEKEH